MTTSVSGGFAGDADAVIAAAEGIVRSAAGSTELRLEAVELPLKLASHNLMEATDAALGALDALFTAALAYAPLQDAARREMAALGLGPADPEGGPPTNAVEADGTVVLNGHAYASTRPVRLLLQTVHLVLTDRTELDPGTWIELTVNAPNKEDGS